MKKQIKIEKTASGLIEQSLKEANGGAHAHAFTSAHEILPLAFEAEQEMDSINLRNDLRPGAIYVAYSGGPVASSYKYYRAGTRVVLQRRSKDWYLIDACSVGLAPDSGGSTKLTLTEDAIAYLKKRIDRKYS